MTETFTPPIDTFDGLPATPESACPSDRRFLVGGWSVPQDAARITPHDELTGIPYPIAPVRSAMLLNDKNASKHHSSHPSNDEALKFTRGGRALRCARIQVVTPEQHNVGPTRYHAFWDGPPIPHEEMDQFGMLLVLGAGFHGERVLDTSQGEPIDRPMREWERKRLRLPGQYSPPDYNEVKRYRDKRKPDLTLFDAKKMLLIQRETQAMLSYRDLRYGYDVMRDFMASYVVERATQVDDSRLRQQFKETGDIDKGLKLLSMAASLTVEHTVYRGRQLGEVYRQLHSTGLLHPLMPRNAAQLIIDKLGNESRRSELLPNMRRQLLAVEDQVA